MSFSFIKRDNFSAPKGDRYYRDKLFLERRIEIKFSCCMLINACHANINLLNLCFIGMYSYLGSLSCLFFK